MIDQELTEFEDICNVETVFLRNQKRKEMLIKRKFRLQFKRDLRESDHKDIMIYTHIDIPGLEVWTYKREQFCAIKDELKALSVMPGDFPTSKFVIKKTNY